MRQGHQRRGEPEWKLDLFLKGRASEKLLDSYQAERKPNVIEVTQSVKKLGKMICERDPVAARQRDAEALASQGGKSVKTRMSKTLSQASRPASSHETEFVPARHFRSLPEASAKATGIL